MPSKHHGTPPLCYFKLFASFQNHQWIYTGVSVQIRPTVVKTGEFVSPATLKFHGWPVLSPIKRCASFYRHVWTQTEMTVWKLLNWILTSVTLTSDLRSWPCMDMVFLVAITPGNFMMIRWKAHWKRVTDGQTDGWTEPSIELLGRNYKIKWTTN